MINRIKPNTKYCIFRETWYNTNKTSGKLLNIFSIFLMFANISVCRICVAPLGRDGLFCCPYIHSLFQERTVIRYEEAS